MSCDPKRNERRHNRVFDLISLATLLDGVCSEELMTGSLPSICRPGNEPEDGPQSEEPQRLRVFGEGRR